MAKTIKFNLICNNKPIRTIEDLQNNFYVEDILAYYNNKLLHRWLSVREYELELKAVNAITSKDPIDIIKSLMRIFNIADDNKKIEESIYINKYLDERKQLYSIYEKEKYNVDRIVEDYKNGYINLVKGILNNPNDIALIRANIAEILSNYLCIFEVSYKDLFWVLSDNKSVLAIMCLIENKKSRDYYWPVKTKKENGTIINDLKENFSKKLIVDKIYSMITSSNFNKSMGENYDLIKTTIYEIKENFSKEQVVEQLTAELKEIINSFKSGKA